MNKRNKPENFFDLGYFDLLFCRPASTQYSSGFITLSLTTYTSNPIQDYNNAEECDFVFACLTIVIIILAVLAFVCELSYYYPWPDQDFTQSGLVGGRVLEYSNTRLVRTVFSSTRARFWLNEHTRCGSILEIDTREYSSSI